MKKTLSILILVIATLTCKKPVVTSFDAVEFVHSGVQEKFIRPLYISEKDLNLQLNDDELKSLQKLIGKSIITVKEKEEYLKSLINFLKTDKITYSTSQVSEQFSMLGIYFHNDLIFKIN